MTTQLIWCSNKDCDNRELPCAVCGTTFDTYKHKGIGDKGHWSTFTLCICDDCATIEILAGASMWIWIIDVKGKKYGKISKTQTLRQ